MSKRLELVCDIDRRDKLVVRALESTVDIDVDDSGILCNVNISEAKARSLVEFLSGWLVERDAERNKESKVTASKDKQTPQVGDIIHIRTQVTKKGGGFLTLRLSAEGKQLGAHEINITDDAPCIVSIEQRPLAIGDEVRGTNWVETAKPGNIVAIDGDDAWVKRADREGGTSGGIYGCIYKLSTLRRTS